MTFEELKFEPDPHHYAGIKARVFFPNGYGASVVRNRMTYGGDAGLYELAVLIGTSEHFDLCYTSPITDDVVGHLPPAAVTGLLKEIEELPPVGGTESRGEPLSINAEVEELRAALSHICEHFSDRPDTGACCHAALDRGRRALRLTAEKGAGNE